MLNGNSHQKIADSFKATIRRTIARKSCNSHRCAQNKNALFTKNIYTAEFKKSFLKQMFNELIKQKNNLRNFSISDNHDLIRKALLETHEKKLKKHQEKDPDFTLKFDAECPYSTKLIILSSGRGISRSG